MMNDRFDGLLRGHLLEAADVRPAEGQLAAVVQGVAVTPQRHPLAARLSGLPGRIGPFSAAAVRYGIIAVALLVVTMIAATLIGTARPSTVFEGTWTSIDPGDGSTQTLEVAAGTAPAVQFVDAYATGLACRDDAVKVFKSAGHGTVTGNQLAVVFPDGGGCGSMVVEVGPGTYTFDQATGTIVDDQGLTWTRVRDALVPATSRPTTPSTEGPTPEITAEPVATAEASPEASQASDSCIQFDAEGTYTAGAGTLPIAVTVPGAPGQPWSGDRDGFALRKATCDGPGMPLIKASLVAQVYADACHWEGGLVDVPTAFDAAQELGRQTGHDTVGPIETQLGAFRATRYDFSVPSSFDDSACDLADDGFHYLRLWGDQIMVPGTTVQVYVAEVDGVTLIVKASYYTAEVTQADLDQLDAMMASLRISI